MHPISAVQIEYSPFAMDIESPEIGLLEACRELGVAVVAYSPLGRGFVTGQYRSPHDFEEGDFRKIAPRFSKENFPKNLKLVDQLTELAKKKNCTPGQLTLAWLMAQGEDIIPIPGTKKVKYLEENVGALQVKLTKEENEEIRKAIEATEVQGERYPAAYVHQAPSSSAQCSLFPSGCCHRSLPALHLYRSTWTLLWICRLAQAEPLRMLIDIQRILNTAGQTKVQLVARIISIRHSNKVIYVVACLRSINMSLCG